MHPSFGDSLTFSLQAPSIWPRGPIIGGISKFFPIAGLELVSIVVEVSHRIDHDLYIFYASPSPSIDRLPPRPSRHDLDWEFSQYIKRISQDWNRIYGYKYE